jgi:molybdopterin-guanine dinucleotide biosynthesis protein A
MGGEIKAFLEVGGNTILDRLLGVLKPNFEEILLVTRQPELYSSTPVRVVNDLYDARSSMTGIHAGLRHAEADFAFVVPSDMPFLQPALIKLLLEQLNPRRDIVIPYIDRQYEPLCAIYSKRCIPAIEAQLNVKDYKILNFFDKMKVKTLSAEQLKTADPKLLSFLNINTPAAYSACQNLIKEISL